MEEETLEVLQLPINYDEVEEASARAAQMIADIEASKKTRTERLAALQSKEK